MGAKMLNAETANKVRLLCDAAIPLIEETIRLSESVPSVRVRCAALRRAWNEGRRIQAALVALPDEPKGLQHRIASALEELRALLPELRN